MKYFVAINYILEYYHAFIILILKQWVLFLLMSEMDINEEDMY